MKDWLRNQPIAHRGLHDLEAGRPENSLGAFAAAMDRGDPIERDVQLSADGRAMVFHDSDLERLTGADGKLATTGSDRLTELRLGTSDEKIPTLEAVLSLVDGNVPLLVELKSMGLPLGPLEVAVADCLRDYGGEFAVQSFSPATVGWFRHHQPAMIRGLIATDYRWKGWKISPFRKFLLRNLLLAPFCRPNFISYDIDCLPYWAPNLARRMGLPLLSWTVRTQDQRAVAERYADNVIFEAYVP